MMKKITILLLAITAGFSSLNAQSLQMVKFDTLVVGNAWTDGDINTYAVVKNISPLPVEVALKRIDANYTELTDSNAICWGLCFTTGISQNPPSYNRIIQPGETDTAIVHVYPDKDGYTRTGFIDYVLFDYYNPTDSVGFRVNYRVDGKPLTINEEVKPNVSVYPNPADDFLRVQYEVGTTSENTFELINLVGATVYQTKLNADQTEVQLDLSDIRPGVYFYVLKGDGEVQMCKKLVIR